VNSPGVRPTAWIALAFAIGLAVIAMAAYAAMRGDGAAPSLIGGPFALTTGDGATLTDADVKGKPFLVFFGYTHCPDVCPTTLSQIADIDKRLPPGKSIRTLFVTVDPERDTPAVMKDYVSSFDPSIVGLTGDAPAIAKIEKAYRVYARKEPPTAGGDYAMSHSAVIYLMDAKGRFIEAFNTDRPPEESAKELAGYL